MPDLLIARDLEVGHSRPLFPALNFSLRAGELTCLLGRNGSGKTTLLKTLAGLHPPRSGGVWLGETSLRSFRERDRALRLAVLLTDAGLPPFLWGRELVALGRTPHLSGFGSFRDSDRKAVSEAMTQMRCEGLADRRLGELSDGERQRLCLARSLAQDTPILLLDEPTAHLDLPAKIEVLLALRELAHRTGKSVLAAVHDLDLALGLSDRCLILTPDAEPFLGAPEKAVPGPLSQAFPGLPEFWDPLALRLRAPISRPTSPISATGIPQN